MMVVATVGTDEWSASPPPIGTDGLAICVGLAYEMRDLVDEIWVVAHYSCWVQVPRSGPVFDQVVAKTRAHVLENLPEARQNVTARLVFPGGGKQNADASALAMAEGMAQAFDQWEVQRPAALDGTALVVQTNGVVWAGQNYPVDSAPIEPRGGCVITLP